MKRPLLAFCALLLARAGVARADEVGTRFGHSLHGEAFDDGPRQQARRMRGMGDVHFPVTTKNADAQAFFDQGTAQLHTFYYYEAERSFRQAALLDPDCAMAYWGMAMANVNNGGRARQFMEKARARQDRATDREKKYIEALDANYREGKKDEERRQDYVKGLEGIVLAYPDDIEAKAFLAWALVTWRPSSRVAVNVLIEDVLRRSPLHPGANHYRIHLWDGNDPAQALESALAYGRAAPGIAHAWHMPGHIFNGLSRWHEAAYQQEASLRVDHAQLLESRVMPFEIHNYAHNTHYLIANLSHLGRVHDAVSIARNLIEEPRDPQKNDKSNGGGGQRLGRISLLRIYVRYGLWDDVLTDPHLDWSDVPEEKGLRSYGRGLAFLEKGDRRQAGEEAETLERLAAEAQKGKGGDTDLLEALRCELKGRLEVREGKLLEGFELLEKGARLGTGRFKGDLAGYPRPFREAVAYAHLEAQDWGLAEANFDEVLADRKNTLPSLAGLVEARHRGGKAKEAAQAYALFQSAWAEADHDLGYLKRLEPVAAALKRDGLLASAPAALAVGSPTPSGPAAVQSGAAPPPEKEGEKDARKASEKRVEEVDLSTLGPRLWEPAPAPDFALEDTDGKQVRLSSFRGKDVLLVFHLGAACAKCLEQVELLGREQAALETLDTKLLVVSDDPPEKSREALAAGKGKPLPRPLLSDPGRKAAKLYGAHDTFEDVPLHGVFLIDRAQRVRWARVAAEPFMDVGFLKSEIERVNRLVGHEL